MQKINRANGQPDLKKWQLQDAAIKGFEQDMTLVGCTAIEDKLQAQLDVVLPSLGQVSHGSQLAIPMGNPYCSCELTRSTASSARPTSSSGS